MSTCKCDCTKSIDEGFVYVAIVSKIPAIKSEKKNTKTTLRAVCLPQCSEIISVEKKMVA